VTTKRPWFELVNLLEAAIAVGNRRAARVLMARLDCVAHPSSGPVFQTCIARHLGDAAVLVGDRQWPCGATVTGAATLVGLSSSSTVVVRSEETLDLLAHRVVSAEMHERAVDYLVRGAKRARRRSGPTRSCSR
jgi:hypothetical protein